MVQGGEGSKDSEQREAELQISLQISTVQLLFAQNPPCSSGTILSSVKVMFMSYTIISFRMPLGAHVCTTVFFLKLLVIHLSPVFPMSCQLFCRLLYHQFSSLESFSSFVDLAYNQALLALKSSLICRVPPFGSVTNYSIPSSMIIFASSTPLSYTFLSHSSQSKHSSHTACWYSSYSCSSFTLHLYLRCCTTCGGFACPILSSSTILYARGDVVLLVAVKFTFLHMPQNNMNFRSKDCSVACCIMNARNMHVREPLQHHSFQGCADVSSEWYCI